MRRRTCKVVICVLGLAGATVAQNTSNTLNQQRMSVVETLSNSEQERLRWEAAETWSRPAAPHEQLQPSQHSLHIENERQPTLTLPKLRREWLQPSMEAASPQSVADSAQRH